MYTSPNFWEDMAKRYPSYDNPSMSRDVNLMIAHSEDSGIDFSGRRVLDIGCGTGTVAIPLARKGSFVTGIDLSEGMLAAFERDAQGAGVFDRVCITRSTWDDFEVAAPYDIVIASMTPAVSEATHIDKMLQSATESGIYVGWGDFRVNLTLKHLFEAHGCDYPMQYGSAHRFADTMRSRGIEVSIRFFDTAWEEYMEPVEAERYALTQLEQHNVLPDPAVVASILDTFQSDQGICFRTEAQKGVVVWHQTRAS